MTFLFQNQFVLLFDFLTFFTYYGCDSYLVTSIYVFSPKCVLVLSPSF